MDFAGCDCDCQPVNSYIEVSLCSLQKKDNKLEDGSDKGAQNSNLSNENMTEYASIRRNKEKTIIIINIISCRITRGVFLNMQRNSAYRVRLPWLLYRLYTQSRKMLIETYTDVEY